MGSRRSLQYGVDARKSLGGQMEEWSNLPDPRSHLAQAWALRWGISSDLASLT